MFRFLLFINSILLTSTSLFASSNGFVSYINNNKANLIYINEALESQNLGFVQTKEEALNSVEFILTTVAPEYEVLINNNYNEIVVVSGNELFGYTGTVNFYYEMPIDIRIKLPGADLGVFTTQDLARQRMDEIITKTDYSVIVDSSQSGIFNVYGNTQENYIGQSIYEYSLLPNIDITTKLPGAYLGYFRTKELARARLDSMILKTGYSVSVDDTNENQFIVSGNEQAGYEGNSIYTYNVY